jgi:hypothetical protein
VGANHAESYALLLEAIERFRQEQDLDDLQVAARRWYVDVFRPLWEAIRARQMIAAFPSDRSADLIARLAAWREREAPELDWQSALDRFLESQIGAGTDNSSSRNG